MDQREWINTMPKLVHVNPNFVKRQQIINQVPDATAVIPHINPKFKHIDINTLMVDCYKADNGQLHSHYTGNPQIHFNPKILDIANIKANISTHNSTAKEPEYIVLTKNKIIKNKQPALVENISLATETQSVPKCVNNKRKPSYSLVRKCNNVSKNKIPSTSNKVSDNMRFKYSQTNLVCVNSSMNTCKSTERVTPYKLCRKSNNHNSKDMQSIVKKSPVSEKLAVLKNKSNFSKSIVFVRGEKFLIQDNTMQRVIMPNAKLVAPPSLKLATSPSSKMINRICVSGVTYIRKNENLFTIDNRIKNFTKKLKKMNIPCPTYRKLGFCYKNKMNRCSLIHDPKNISVCSKYLKGSCNDGNCKLSHQAVAEKMTTCKFYLDGSCVRENCPYPHVKVNESAKICLEFVRGFCSKGKQCESKHINVCPEFHKHGKCKQKLCPYPHRILKSKTPAMPSTTGLNKKAQKISDVDQSKIKDGQKQTCEVSRYFQEHETQQGAPSEDTIKLSEKQGNYLENRPKLGKLPSFISL